MALKIIKKKLLQTIFHTYIFSGPASLEDVESVNNLGVSTCYIIYIWIDV